MAIDETLGQQLQAMPVHAPRRYERLPLDPRLAKKFARSPAILPEERQQLIQYIRTSKWVPDSRAVYGAVVDGFSTIEEISTVTGLSIAKVNTAVNELAQKGYLKRVTSV